MNDALSTVRQVLKIVGMVLVVVALLKLFGVQIPIRANLIELAAIAIACLHA